MKKWMIRTLMCAALVGLFCLPASATAEQVALDVSGLESLHYYSNNTNRTWTLSHLGAVSISLTFDSRTAFENNFDFLYIYNGAGNQVGKYSGLSLSGKTITVEGDSVQLKLTSDHSNTYWGFKVTAATATIETIPDDWRGNIVVGEVSHGTLQVDKTTAAYEETVTVTAVPEEGWRLAKVYVNGQAVEGTQFPCPYSDTVTVTAEFEAIVYSITVDESVAGQITPSKSSATVGQTITVAANVAGESIGKLYVNGVEQDGLSFTMPACDVTLTAQIIELRPGQTLVANGSCGTNVKWCLYENGELVIFGTGAMNDYSESYYSGTYRGNGPWTSYHGRIKAVTVESGVTAIGACAFYGYDALITVTMGDSVTSIGDSAFCDCDALTTVTMGDSVTSIGDSAFCDCDALTTVTIGDSVTSIGGYAFDDCSALTTVTIGDSVTGIGNYAFSDCYALTTVYYTGDVADWCGISFGNYCANPLYYAEKLYMDGELVTELVIPERVSAIGAYAFNGYNALTAVTIGDSVTYIGDDAFYNCDALTTVTLPDSVTGIGAYAFSDCGALAHVFYMGDADSWSAISIGNNNSPLTGAARHYITGLTDIVTVTTQACENGTFSAPTMAAKGETITVEVTPDPGYKLGKLCANGVEQDGITFTVPDDSQNLVITAEFALVRPEDTIAASGTCGAKAYWVLYASGELYIYGTGAMADYYYSSNSSSVDTPWWSRRGSIKSVIVDGAVTSIGNRALYNCSALTTVTIGDSVTSIGNYAFYNCSALTTVTIGDSVTDIGNYAFYNCGTLTTVTIPDSVTGIGDYAFHDCSALTTVTIGESVTSIGYNAFQYCSRLTTVYYTGDVADWCGISFGNYCANPLYYADKLYIGGKPVTDLVIPDSVTGVDEYAFYGYSGLTSVVVGSGVTTIGESAFSNCSALTAVVIPAAATTIRDYAFSACSKLSRVFYVGEEAGWYSIAIGADNTALTDAQRSYITKEDLIPVTVEECTNGSISVSLVVRGAEVTLRAQPDLGYTLSKLTINGVEQRELTFTVPQDVTQLVIAAEFTALRPGQTVIAGGSCGISAVWSLTQDGELIISGTGAMYDYDFHYNGSYAIGDTPWESYCEMIKSVVITDGVTSIGDSAFCGCIALTTVTIGESVTSIGGYAFAYCDALTTVTMGGGVTSIGNNAFRDCDALTTVTIGESVTSIGNNAFRDCDALTTVTMGDSVTSIGDSAFCDCSALTTVTMGDSVTGIGNYAFRDCDALTTVTMGGGVTSIGNNAFRDCDALTTVTIPDSVTSIGYDAFSACYALTTVYYTGEVADWCGISFGNYYANPLYYADKLYMDGELVTELVIPEGVTAIGAYAFYYYNALTSVTVPAGVTSIGNYAFAGCYLAWAEFMGDAPAEFGNNVFYCGDSYSGDQSTTAGKFVIHYHSGTSGWTSPKWNGYYAFCGDDVDYSTLNEENRNAQNILFTLNESAKTATVGNNSTGSNNSGYAGGKYGMAIIPDTVSKNGVSYRVIGIGQNAFSGNKTLRGVELGKNITSVDPLAFTSCSNFAAFTVAEGNTYYSVQDGVLYDKNKFYLYVYPGGKEQTEFTVPASVEDIGPNAFSAPNLTRLTVPKTVQSIGECAFRGCSNLQSITLPFIGGSRDSTDRFSYTFTDYYYYMDGFALTHVTITDDTLKPGAFSGCDRLQSITLTGRDTEIPNNCFSGCSNLEQLIFAGGSVPEPGQLVLPERITAIGYRAFENCAALTKVTIPTKVVSIGESAFAHCTGITEFAVAEGNKNYCSDQWGVLYNKDKTTLINYPSARKWPYYNVAETTKIIESYAFYSCANLVNLYVPKTVNAMYQEAISYCPGMTVCAYRGSVAYAYATTNNISAWPMDNYRLQGLEIYSLPEQVVFKKGEVDLTGLYVAANGGRALQADGYTVSYDENGTGVQTVTVSYQGQTATFEILVYDESGIVLDFGNLTLPDGTRAFAAAYDKDGKMLVSQEAIVMGGHVQMTISGEYYGVMKQAKLFILNGESFAPVVEATIKDKAEL